MITATRGLLFFVLDGLLAARSRYLWCLFRIGIQYAAEPPLDSSDEPVVCAYK